MAALPARSLPGVTGRHWADVDVVIVFGLLQFQNCRYEYVSLDYI